MTACGKEKADPQQIRDNPGGDRQHKGNHDANRYPDRQARPPGFQDFQRPRSSFLAVMKKLVRNGSGKASGLITLRSRSPNLPR